MLLPHRASSLSSEVFMLYTKKKKQDPELFLCVHETIRTPVRTKMFEPPIWNPTKLQQESADFFFRPVVERGLCDFLLCACRPHLLQTRSRDRISVWNVKIFIMTHFILYSTFKVFFFSFHFFLSQKQVFGNLPAGVKIKSVTSVWLGSFHQVSVCFMRKCLNR